MGVFDNFVGNWIQIMDDQNSKTIEDYGYDTGVMEGTTKSHCVKCTAVNKCWFKNEKGKKPEPFEITKIQMIDAYLNGLIPGLYHYKCHCKENNIFYPTSELIELIVPDGKAWWTLTDKKDWINSMGYDADNIFINILEKYIKIAYSSD